MADPENPAAPPAAETTPPEANTPPQILTDEELERRQAELQASLLRDLLAPGDTLLNLQQADEILAQQSMKNLRTSEEKEEFERYQEVLEERRQAAIVKDEKLMDIIGMYPPDDEIDRKLLNSGPPDLERIDAVLEKIRIEAQLAKEAFGEMPGQGPDARSQYLTGYLEAERMEKEAEALKAQIQAYKEAQEFFRKNGIAYPDQAELQTTEGRAKYEEFRTYLADEKGVDIPPAELVVYPPPKDRVYDLQRDIITDLPELPSKAAAKSDEPAVAETPDTPKTVKEILAGKENPFAEALAYSKAHPEDKDGLKERLENGYKAFAEKAFDATGRISPGDPNYADYKERFVKGFMESQHSTIEHHLKLPEPGRNADLADMALVYDNPTAVLDNISGSYKDGRPRMSAEQISGEPPMYKQNPESLGKDLSHELFMDIKVTRSQATGVAWKNGQRYEESHNNAGDAVASVINGKDRHVAIAESKEKYPPKPVEFGKGDNFDRMDKAIDYMILAEQAETFQRPLSMEGVKEGRSHKQDGDAYYGSSYSYTIDKMDERQRILIDKFKGDDKAAADWAEKEALTKMARVSSSQLEKMETAMAGAFGGDKDEVKKYLEEHRAKGEAGIDDSVKKMESARDLRTLAIAVNNDPAMKEIAQAALKDAKAEGKGPGEALALMKDVTRDPELAELAKVSLARGKELEKAGALPDGVSSAQEYALGVIDAAKNKGNAEQEKMLAEEKKEAREEKSALAKLNLGATSDEDKAKLAEALSGMKLLASKIGGVGVAPAGHSDTFNHGVAQNNKGGGAAVEVG